jgi:hypothetical protein
MRMAVECYFVLYENKDIATAGTHTVYSSFLSNVAELRNWPKSELLLNSCACLIGPQSGVLVMTLN